MRYIPGLATLRIGLFPFASNCSSKVMPICFIFCDRADTIFAVAFPITNRLATRPYPYMLPNCHVFLSLRDAQQIGLRPPPVQSTATSIVEFNTQMPSSSDPSVLSTAEDDRRS